MGVSRDEVVWAYRLILGREPENEGAIANWTAVKDRRELAYHFLMSAEARSRPLVQTVDQYVYESASNVQVDCDSATLDRMLAGIRDAWSRFGETEPHWSVITHADYSSENIAKHIDQFYASGHGVSDRVLATLRRNGIEPSGLRNAIDFGCGVGRITFALANHFDQVIGVDVSEGHLKLARERAVVAGPINAAFRSISAIHDIDGLPPCDLVVSFIVLQHNPPPVALDAIRRLFARLAPGGVAIFQIPTFIQGYSFSAHDYFLREQPQMEVNAVPQKDVFRTIREGGGDMLEVREDLSIANMLAVSQVFVAQKR